MPKVSVLVAVYNTEQYLRQCLDSLVNQTLTDIEIICIDDASTDGSYGILKEYADRDKRFVILRNEKNIGHSASRNKGIEFIRGEYTCFLDSDDWFEPDSLELMVNVMETGEETDSVIFRLVKHFEETGTTEEYENELSEEGLTGDEAFLKSIDWRIHGVSMSRTQLFRDIRYDTACRYNSGDNSVRFQYLHSRRVVQGGGIYNYRRNATSGTEKISIHTFDHIVANLSLKESIEREYAEGQMSDEVFHSARQILELMRFRNLLAASRRYYVYNARFTAEEKKEIQRRIRVVLQSLNSQLIPFSHRCKFGYWLIKNYSLFMLQEKIFSALRRLLGMKVC